VEVPTPAPPDTRPPPVVEVDRPVIPREEPSPPIDEIPVEPVEERVVPPEIEIDEQLIVDIEPQWEEDPDEEMAPSITVPLNSVVAVVNGTPLMLEHLVALRPEDRAQNEKSMNLDEYAARLDRAIEMELVFQEAASAGVDLTPDQLHRLDGIRRRHEDTIAQYRERGIEWSSITDAQIEFETRYTASILLQNNLLEQRGVALPASTGDDHRALLDDLRGEAEIEILLQPPEEEDVLPPATEE